MNTSAKVTDIKALVARLMATENLNVRFENVDTAAFDPVTRTLVIPNYKDDLSRAEYDLFIGHEVGHALFTPEVRPSEVDPSRPGFGPFVNVVEDVRIEKAIQKKYPGLTRSFHNGYSDLIKRGFFGKNLDYDKMNLGDKANLFFKAGFHHTGITFTADEQPIVDKIAAAKSWDEVVAAAQTLYDYVGQQADEEQQEGEGGDSTPAEKGNTSENKNQSSGGQNGSEDSADDNADGNDNGDNESEAGKGSGKAGNDTAEGDDDADAGEGDADGDADGDEGDASTPTAGGGMAGAGSIDPPKIMTQQNFEKSTKDQLVDSKREGKIQNGYIPEPTDASVVSWTDTYTDLANRVNRVDRRQTASVLDQGTEAWKEFKSENKSIVMYLAKEFEMRKSADEHQRTRIAKTGSLNTNVLHKYKFSEDLFRKAAVVSSGKSHGIVMVVDWSGSMSGCIVDTINQIVIMAMFCRQVNIPFDVYAFNSHFTGIYVDGENESSGTDRLPSFTTNDGDFALEARSGYVGRFKLIQYLSSSMKSAQFEKAMAYLMLVRDASNSYSWNGIGDFMGWHRLGGTPLVEAIVATAKVVNEFRDKYRLQIVNTIFLTDGQGNYSYGVWEKDDGGHGYGRSTVIHDRKMKTFYKSNDKETSDSNWTFQPWLDWFRDKTNTEIINFYIFGRTENDLNCSLQSFGAPRLPEDDNDFSYKKRRRYCTAEEWKQVMKDGHMCRNDIPGYGPVLFIRSTNLKIAEDQFEKIGEDASLARKRNAFIKNQRSKVASRMFMEKIAELIS